MLRGLAVLLVFQPATSLLVTVLSRWLLG